MTTLVTGAGGFLGGYVVERLLAHGQAKLRCLFRSGRGRIPELQQSHPSVDIECVSGNLLSAQDLKRILDGVDEIYHLAAEMRGAPADLYLNTVVASKRLLEASTNIRRIVLVSSFGVYGVADLPRGAMIDEKTPLESHPECRDAYSFAKWRQEKLFREYQAKMGFDLIILRPGVIYGPGSTGLSTRIGIKLPGFLLHVGRSNLLPLTHVENCAEAIVIAGRTAPPGAVLNVVDDDLPTCRQYLRRFKRARKDVRAIPAPYFGALLFARAIERYSRWSRGQLPAVLTPYKAAALWKGNRFQNVKLKETGWRQLVSTETGLGQTMASLAER